MDEYRVGTEPHAISPAETELVERDARRSKAKSAWQGAKTGFRWVSYFAGFFAVIAVSFGLAVSALGVGSGRGWGLHISVTRGILFYLICLPWGMVPGALVGWFAALGRLAPEGSRRSKLSAVAERPIHPLRWVRRQRPADAAGAVPRRSRRRVWPWLVAVPMVVAIIAGFVTGGHLGRIVDRRLADAVVTADADNPSWRLDDLMAGREAVPDEENSALVVEDALSRLPDRWPLGPAPGPDEPKPPPTDAVKALDQLNATKDNVRLDDATVASLRGELDAYEDAVVVARSVANFRRGRHEIELGPTLIDTLLPETQAARNAARLLTADAAIRAHDGDLDGALDSCRALLSVGRSIGDEPFIISQLVRVAIGGVAMKSTRRALAQGEPSDAALARLQALVLDEIDQPLLLYALNGERAILTELILRIGSGEVPIAEFSGTAAKLVNDLKVSPLDPWGELWFDNQWAVATEWTTENIAIARRPAPERPGLWQAWNAKLQRIRESRFGILLAPLPFLMIPAVESADTACSRYQCELGTSAILLAAERHRRKTGDWPESIAKIDSAILPNAPLDPYSGQAFRMVRRDGRLLIYSIGRNLKDEGGQYDPKRSGTGVADDVGTGAWDVKLRRQMPATGDAEPSGTSGATETPH